jgi:formylglycine-generating enzyme required for sulfatase activity
MIETKHIKFKREVNLNSTIYEKKHLLMHLTMFLLLLVIVCVSSGCINDSSENDENTGTISFDMAFSGVAGQEYSDLGIVEIRCNVYDGVQNQSTYLIGETFSSNDFSGRIANVPAGNDRLIAVIGKDSEGNNIYYGKEAEIMVTPGQIVYAGVITMDQVNINNSIGMSFVFIPPGTFMMGSPIDETGRSSSGVSNEVQHQVTLTQGFYMQTTEVTQGQWKAVMGYNPSYFDSLGDDYPVETVSWINAHEFIDVINSMGEGTYRLPTEAEWEYSARAVTSTPFAFGKCLSTSQANYQGNYPYEDCPPGINREQTTKVASLGKNAWGLYDMHGNIEEWCEDFLAGYPSRLLIDPVGPDNGIRRVLRGGHWLNGEMACRSASRTGMAAGWKWHYTGFRLVYSPN